MKTHFLSSSKSCSMKSSLDKGAKKFEAQQMMNVNFHKTINLLFQTQRAENTVMQALESLNDSQVNDFLSGKSPLNLSVRLGDHMMLIQLQLSTINPTQQSTSSQSQSQTSASSVTGSSQSTKPGRSSTLSNRSSSHGHHTSAYGSAYGSSHTSFDAVPSTSKPETPLVHRRSHSSSEQHLNSHHHHLPVTTSPYNSSKTRSPTDANVHNDLNSYLRKQEVENLESIVKSLSNILEQPDDDTKKLSRVCVASPVPAPSTESYPDAMLEQSPIKSLSNLVCSSMNDSGTSTTSSTPVKSSPAPIPPLLDCSVDPISANLTSCLCKRLDSNSNGCESHCSTPISSNSRSPSITKPEQIIPNFGLPAAGISSSSSSGFGDGSRLSASANSSPILKSHHHYKSRHSLKRHHSASSVLSFNDSSSSSSLDSPNSSLPPDTDESAPNTPNPASTGDNPTLAEASRNLTQTLRKLSKKVFPRGDGSRRIASGAVIESMKHHGKGIYSGTFSGTLNPALQDKHGRPKRDISTIIHILNDLLSAAPHCARNGAKIYFEPTTSSATGVSATPGQTGTTSAINVTAQPSTSGAIKSMRQVS